MVFKAGEMIPPGELLAAPTPSELFLIIPSHISETEDLTDRVQFVGPLEGGAENYATHLAQVNGRVFHVYRCVLEKRVVPSSPTIERIAPAKARR